MGSLVGESLVVFRAGPRPWASCWMHWRAIGSRVDRRVAAEGHPFVQVLSLGTAQGAATCLFVSCTRAGWVAWLAGRRGEWEPPIRTPIGWLRIWWIPVSPLGEGIKTMIRLDRASSS